MKRRRYTLFGAVQGVGFRPHVFGLAHKLGLGGYVRNTGSGLAIELEGESSALEHFERDLRERPPAGAEIHRWQASEIAALGERSFRIDPSTLEPGAARPTADRATCEACLEELFDASDRRYRYPFLSCAQCGPRFSILTGLPYDRARTTMARFTLCQACEREFRDPSDRRFHAQTIACGECGPQVALLGPGGVPMATKEAAIQTAREQIAGGAIVAVLGLGGFHLMLDAANGEAVARLRRRKRRPTKPFAVMTEDLAWAERIAHVDAPEAEWLRSAEAPIVLLERRQSRWVAAEVAPEQPDLGVQLAASPLHHLLLRDLGCVVVATSGNLSGEPLCTRAEEAVDQLADVADAFLTHDRPIQRPLDDSVVRVVCGKSLVLRSGRGRAPVHVSMRAPSGGLALGGHLKSSVALALGNEAALGPHLGDLDGSAARDRLRQAVVDLQTLYQIPARHLAHDRHPDYASTLYAETLNGARLAVQHHVAHALACMAEHGLDHAVAVVWDGSGLGEDGQLWGGEFFQVRPSSIRRIASFYPFALPGGERAAREPRRVALGALLAAGVDPWSSPAASTFSASERQLLASALQRGFHAPRTSSVGRLFDAAASLCGLLQVSDHEGQAAMRVEHAARRGPASPRPWEVAVLPMGELDRVDWRPALRELFAEKTQGTPVEELAGRFHATLVEAVRRVVDATSTEEPIVLAGGCFQNRWLIEQVSAGLTRLDRAVYWPQRVPPNDGALALGQLSALARPDQGKLEGAPPCA